MRTMFPPGIPSSVNDPSSLDFVWACDLPKRSASGTCRKLIQASTMPAPVLESKTRPRTAKPRSSGMTVSRVRSPSEIWNSPTLNIRYPGADTAARQVPAATSGQVKRPVADLKFRVIGWSSVYVVSANANQLDLEFLDGLAGDRVDDAATETGGGWR